MKGIVFDAQKRAFLSIDKASIPIMDVGFQRAVGVFDSLLAYNGSAFQLSDRLKRLHLSARLLGIKEHFLSAYIEEKIKIGIKKINEPLVSIRIIITGGDAHYLSFKNDPRLYIIFSEFDQKISCPPEAYERGVSLMTTPLLRTLPVIKTLNCLGAVVSYQTARRKKYYDAVYVDKNRLLEGTTFNIGIIIKNNLIVPKDNVLEGIAMQTVLKLSRKLNLNIFRKPITMKELRSADEAFITSSTREVMPVVRVDQIKIGDGKPGRYSRELLRLYQELTKK